MQKEVLFYEDVIVAVKVPGGTVFVPITPICDNLGISPVGQRERINRDPVLSEAVMAINVTLSQQAREMTCLPLKFIPGWLFGINANRVKPELRERIIRYQRECYEVLWEAFQDSRLTADPAFDELLQQDSEAVEAYKMLTAMVKLARNQIVMEARLDVHEERLEELESKLGDPARLITPDQASQVSQAVKAIALEIGRQSKRNEFGAVYGELYRKFGITSYKELPAARFKAAMAFLREWYQSLTDQATPF